jgi:hypothetical protein
VALPLTELQDVELKPYRLGVREPEMGCGPADIVSVIGFPFGLRGGGSLAIWATGFIASEPAIDFQDLPIFLIDCRSRSGQSGSAVIMYRGAGQTFAYKDGRPGFSNGPVFNFLGIYSGRINAESDLGIVWKEAALIELIDSLR